jgi:hypothetical protein
MYGLLYLKNSMEKINEKNTPRSKYFQRFYNKKILSLRSIKVQF